MLSGWQHSFESVEFLEETKAKRQDLERQINAELKAQEKARRAFYKNLTKNDEGAMNGDETNRALSLYNKLRDHYWAQFQQQGGTEGVLKTLEHYLVVKTGTVFEREDPSTRAFVMSDLPEIQQAKSALRLLIDKAPKSSHFENVFHINEKPLYIGKKFIHAREILAYLWLAACDPILSPKQQEEEKLQVMLSMADIRRAHNRLGDYAPEDDENDQLSCPMGVPARLALMHVHNPLTALEEITSPSVHFPLRVLAYINERFKQMPVDAQLKIIFGNLNSILNDEHDEGYQLYQAFIKSLVDVNHLDAFLTKLITEFEELNETHIDMAKCIYAYQLASCYKGIPQDLLDQFTKTTAVTHREIFKAEVESGLGKNKTIKAALRELLQVANQFYLLQQAIQQQPLPTVDLSLDEMHEREVTWQALQDQFNQLLTIRVEQSKIIHGELQRLCRDRFTELDANYQAFMGQDYSLSQLAALNHLRVSTFWFKKIQIRLDDRYTDCLLRAKEWTKVWEPKRQQVLFEFFKERWNTVPVAWKSEFINYSYQLEQLNQNFEKTFANEKMIGSHSFQEHLALKNGLQRVGQQVIESRRALLEQVLAGTALTDIDKIDIISLALSQLNELTDGLNRAQRYQELYEIYFDSLEKISKSYLARVAQFEEEINQLEQALQDKPKYHNIVTKAKHKLLPEKTKYAAMAPSIEACQAFIEQAEAISGEMNSQLAKKGFGKKRKGVAKLFSKLSLASTSSSSHQTPEAKVSSLAFASLHLISDLQKANRATLVRFRYNTQGGNDRSNHLPGASRFQFPLNSYQVTAASGYLSSHAFDPHSIGLAEYLEPGVAIDWTFLSNEAAELIFSTPMKRGETKRAVFPVEQLKEFSDNQYKLKADTVRCLDLLLQEYSVFMGNGEREKGNRARYVEELNRERVNDNILYQCALNRQPIKYLQELRKTITGGFKRVAAYQEMVQDIDTVIQTKQAKVAAGESEEVLVTAALESLVERSFKHYRREGRAMSASSSS